MAASNSALVMRARLSALQNEHGSVVDDLFQVIHNLENEVHRLKLQIDSGEDSPNMHHGDFQRLAVPDEYLGYRIVEGEGDYVVVLIDGNDAIFLDELLEDPKKGAREAAERIKQAVKVSLAIPILVNVYANVQNLAKTLSDAGVLKYDCDELHKFAQYFNDSNPEFNFINLCSDRKHKMSKMLHHYHRQQQCKKIFFVGCLEHHMYDFKTLSHYPGSKDKIVPVETTPARSPFRSMLPFDIIHFENIFRSEPLEAQEPLPTSLSQVYEPLSTLWRDRSGSYSPIVDPTRDTDSETESNAPRTETLYHRPSSRGHRICVPAQTQPRIITRSPKPPPRTIDYNKKHQRLDTELPFPVNTTCAESYLDKHDEIRAQGYKEFCEPKYLTGHCDDGPKCLKAHDAILDPAELALLRYFRRRSQCANGSACADFGCCASHHCPTETAGVCFGVRCQFVHLSEEEKVPWARRTEGKSEPDVLSER